MGTTQDRPGRTVAGGCPTWCVVLHEDDDEGATRRHASASLSVPVRELRAGGDESPPLFGELDPDDGHGERTATTDLAVCLHRRDGAPTTWLYAGDGTEQVLELTVESWHRLVPALDRLLDLARA
ncbi:MAG: hypothetical protein IE923_05160 [Micrococcales bacterium]|nr:hypothetical protein [Micrococcales bacterium]